MGLLLARKKDEKYNNIGQNPSCQISDSNSLMMNEIPIFMKILTPQLFSISSHCSLAQDPV